MDREFPIVMSTQRDAALAVNSRGKAGRILLLICGGLAFFAVGATVGWFAARQMRASVASTDSVETADEDDGLLVQTGEFNAWNQPTEFEVYYAQPYANPPELKIVADGLMAKYQIAEQRSDGFRVVCTATYSPFVDEKQNISRYEARGVPTKSKAVD